ncbi:MAG TPA: hypothetical protein VD999_06560 [Vitreimonas sp.]|nr:hypothetical protein [Vitreimonas sp.]
MTLLSNNSLIEVLRKDPARSPTIFGDVAEPEKGRHMPAAKKKSAVKSAKKTVKKVVKKVVKKAKTAVKKVAKKTTKKTAKKK